jgi:hypothetical protein
MQRTGMNVVGLGQTTFLKPILKKKKKKKTVQSPKLKPILINKAQIK